MTHWVLVFGLVLGACSVQQNSSQRFGTETASVSRPVAPPIHSVPRAVPSPPASAFLPIGNRPRLRDVAAALEADDVRKATRLLSEAIAAQPQSHPESARWAYWLGMLSVRAGQYGEARRAYEAAAEPRWLLTPHAQLGVARALLGEGKPAGALSKLSGADFPQSLQATILALQVEAHVALGQNQQAAQCYRAQLADARSELDRPATRLQLAELLGKSLPIQPHPLDSGQRQTLTEVLALCRLVRAEAADRRELLRKAETLERRMLASLPQAIAAELSQPTPEEQLQRLESSVELREFAAAEPMVNSLLARLELGESSTLGLACRANLAKGKILVGLGRPREALDVYDALERRCQVDSDTSAKALFLAAAQQMRLGEPVEAIRRYEALEKRYPQHRLADDARYKRAMAYLDVNAEAQFTELLLHMVDDYPSGDMRDEGVFQLALRRILRRDWSGAETVLSRLATVNGAASQAPTQGAREIYFLARARLELGDRSSGLSLLQDLVRTRPLTYYMLQAYTRLATLDEKAAQEALRLGQEAALANPQPVISDPDRLEPPLARALELLALGELDLARLELSALPNSDRLPAEIHWTIAALYLQAGAPELALRTIKGNPGGWSGHWPAGVWRSAWQTAFPRPFLAMVTQESSRSKVPVTLAYAVMREESAFDPKARSWADAYGLMQLIVPTARTAARKLSLPSHPNALLQPRINIALGCHVLGGLLSRFDNDLALVASGYNAGPGRPKRWLKERPDLDRDIWIETIPFQETRDYVKRVTASSVCYEWLYGSASPDVLRLALRFPVPT